MSKTDDIGERFAPALFDWYAKHGRHDLPWTRSRSPYHVWLSEIMLQQTQVSTVLGYFSRFISALPTVQALADAPEDQVLGLWTGLGYYSRARNLHKAAKRCVEIHGGAIPDNFAALIALPGIGRSTAGAILSQAFNQPFPILDGNVKRVLTRVIGERDWPGKPAVEKRLWSLAETLMPASDVADYTQAIMDLGATLCTRSKPRCVACPLNELCVAHETGNTGNIPARKPKKPVPERQCAVVWLQDSDGAHFLKKRPETGIWGSLWSLPQFDDVADANAWLAEQGIQEARELPAFRHVFTHFKLEITPVHAVVTRKPQRVREDLPSTWADADTLSTLGMPAPIRKLLETDR